MVLLPAALQQGRPLPLSHLTQPCFYGILPGGVEHHSAQVKRSRLKSCLKDFRDTHEDDVPHEQAKEGGPDATFSMSTCVTMCYGHTAPLVVRKTWGLISRHQMHAMHFKCQTAL